MNESRRSACASICSTERFLCCAATAATTGGVIECSPPRTTGNLPRVTSSDATRSDLAHHLVHRSGTETPSPAACRCRCRGRRSAVSSSHNSICDEATRISCGPVRVPGTYEVVRSSGTGRMTTRALSKSAAVDAAERAGSDSLVFKRQVHSRPRRDRRPAHYRCDVLEKCEVDGGERTNAPEVALRDDDVGFAPQADVRRLLGDEALCPVVERAPLRVVGRRGGLVQQAIDAGIAEAAAVEARRAASDWNGTPCAGCPGPRRRRRSTEESTSGSSRRRRRRTASRTRTCEPRGRCRPRADSAARRRPAGG